MEIRCPAGMQVSAFLRSRGNPVPTPCGGRGNCGKCKIRVLSGELPISSMDRVHLTEEELAEGVRLACQALPATEITIEGEL